MLITRNDISATLKISKVAEKLDKQGKPSANSGREYYSLSDDIPLGHIITWLGDALCESILRGSIDTVLQRKYFDAEAETMADLRKNNVLINHKDENQMKDIQQRIERVFRTSVLDWKPKARLDDWTREMNRLTGLLAKASTPEDKKNWRKQIALHLASQEDEEESA